MKKFALTALLLALQGVAFVASVSAEGAGVWNGYVTYAPQPVTVTPGFQDNDLLWLSEVATLLPPEGFTFLGRRDANHWMSLTRKAKVWLLQLHDETAKFNFRAMIEPKTGKVMVEKGVDWAGMDRAADAAQAVKLAVAYLQRARMAMDLFPGSVSTVPATAVKSPAEAAHDVPTAAAHSTPDHSTAGHSTPAAMLADPMLGSGGLETWQRLVDGNLRFVSGMVTHPNQSMARVEETAKGQKPFVIVVSCSDSRVPPELLFDQGFGDLFVIRTAGEVVTEVELGSIEYAVEHLGATYLVVLGHKRCGAVDATLKGGDLPPNIEAIAAQIRPAVEAARFFKGDPLDNAVRENAKTVLAKIQQTPALAEAMQEGKLNVKAAYYDIDTGKVAALP